jgi:hypothetical protein
MLEGGEINSLGEVRMCGSDGLFRKVVASANHGTMKKNQNRERTPEAESGRIQTLIKPLLNLRDRQLLERAPQCSMTNNVPS